MQEAMEIAKNVLGKCRYKSYYCRVQYKTLEYSSYVNIDLDIRVGCEKKVFLMSRYGVFRYILLL